MALPRPVGIVVDPAVRAFLIVAAVVFLASIVGLASRHAFSVSFWPANAVLVGLLLRNRRLMRLSSWIGATAGFILADIAFGRTLLLASLFAGTNIAGTLTATLLLMRLDARDLQLRRVHSVLRILACLLPACLAAAIGGAVLVIVQFHGSASQAMMTWLPSDLVNYLIVLPAMLTVPLPGQPRAVLAAADRAGWKPGPALALAASCAAAVHFDGPGSIIFPMPALLLCALAYSVPATALLTMVLGAGCLTAVGLGIVDIGQDMAVPRMVVSVRLAVASLVMVPLTISSAMAVRDDLLAKLRHAADRDGLTGLLNRRAFELRMQDRLDTAAGTGGGLAILWLDIDHFKLINDRHGHPAGDAVLQAFAETARACCREDDLVGRMGGEEFALVVRVSSTRGAGVVADRLRTAFAEQVTMWNGTPVQATVSIGACYIAGASARVSDLVNRLDDALYRAKRNGRNRIEWLQEVAAPPPPLLVVRSA